MVGLAEFGISECRYLRTYMQVCSTTLPSLSMGSHFPDSEAWDLGAATDCEVFVKQFIILNFSLARAAALTSHPLLIFEARPTRCGDSEQLGHRPQTILLTTQLKCSLAALKPARKMRNIPPRIPMKRRPLP